MNEKSENQQSPFLAIAKDICSTVFEGFEKIIKEQMEENILREYKARS